MHERGAVAEAVTAVIAVAGDRPVSMVELRLGPGIEEEVTRHLFAELAADTVARHAELTLTRAHHTMQCLECGQDYEGDKLDACPECGGDGLMVVQAPGVAVVEVRTAGDDLRVG